jgi:hypothetical protein
MVEEISKGQENLLNRTIARLREGDFTEAEIDQVRAEWTAGADDPEVIEMWVLRLEKERMS